MKTADTCNEPISRWIGQPINQSINQPFNQINPCFSSLLCIYIFIYFCNLLPSGVHQAPACFCWKKFACPTRACSCRVWVTAACTHIPDIGVHVLAGTVREHPRLVDDAFDWDGMAELVHVKCALSCTLLPFCGILSEHGKRTQ